MENKKLPEEPNIDSLITSYLSDNSSEDEKLRLELWLKQSEKNEEYFRSFCSVWQLSAGLQHSNTNDNAIADKLFPLQESTDFETEESKSRYITFIKYAASILILISAGFFAGKFSSVPSSVNNENNIAIVYAPMGSKAISVLPDGTKVWLNAGSRLEYKTNSYGIISREVELTGEAYFKVKTNPQKPFVVNAKGINVKAFGTEFNVKAYPEESQIVTTLVEGIVKIEGNDKNKRRFSLEMKPKQIVTLNAPASSRKSVDEAVKTPENTNEDKKSRTERIITKPLVINDVNTEKYTSWKDNQWVLDGEEMGNLVVMLERKFNVKILVESPELNKYKFTGTFKNETLEQVLSVLKIVTPMKYTIGKGSVSLKIDPVLKARYQKLITQ